MAAGDRLLNADGDRILDADGNLVLSDGSSDAWCCPCGTFACTCGDGAAGLTVDVSGVDFCPDCQVVGADSQRLTGSIDGRFYVGQRVPPAGECRWMEEFYAEERGYRRDYATNTTCSSPTNLSPVVRITVRMEVASGANRISVWITDYDQFDFAPTGDPDGWNGGLGGLIFTHVSTGHDFADICANGITLANQNSTTNCPVPFGGNPHGYNGTVTLTPCPECLTDVGCGFNVAGACSPPSATVTDDCASADARCNPQGTYAFEGRTRGATHRAGSPGGCVWRWTSGSHQLQVWFDGEHWSCGLFESAGNREYRTSSPISPDCTGGYPAGTFVLDVILTGAGTCVGCTATVTIL